MRNKIDINPDYRTHVVHVVNTLAAGGIETFVAQLAVHQSRTVKVSVVVIFFACELGLEGIKEREHVARLKAAGVSTIFLKTTNRIKRLSKAYFYHRTMSNLSATVVNSHTYRANFFHLLGFRSEPLVYTHHTSVLFTSPTKFSFLDRAVKRYIVNSGAGAKVLEAHTKKPVDTIYHGVSYPVADTIRPKDFKGKFTVIHVGSLRPEKRQDRIIDIAETIRNNYPDLEDSIQFLIIGDGPLKGKLIDETKRRNLNSMVKFLGEKDDVFSYLLASNIYLQTSDLEGLPISLVEAAWAELPLISSRAGGCGEVFADSEAGFLIDPSDISEYSSAILKLYNNSSLRAKMKERSKMIKKKFDMDSCSEKTLEAYNSVNTEL